MAGGGGAGSPGSPHGPGSVSVQEPLLKVMLKPLPAHANRPLSVTQYNPSFAS